MQTRWIALFVAVAFLTPTAAASQAHVALEAREPDRGALDARGQFNCVSEALARGGGRCPAERVETAFVETGVKILDAYYATTGFASPSNLVDGYRARVENPDSPQPSSALFAVRETNYGANAHRGTDGDLPDLILPGLGAFRAWYGWWDDKDLDGVIDIAYEARAGPSGGVARWLEANEWVPDTAGNIVSYIDPGSRPSYASVNRPADGMPEFAYYYRGGEVLDYAQSGQTLHTDGSLLQTYHVATVTDAFPAPEGDFPFTPTATSLVDLDVHPAAAPGPLAALYAATLAGPVNALGSPSTGYCPDQCRPTLPLAALASVAPVGGLVYAPYPREWAEGSGSSNEGRLFDADGNALAGGYAERYQPWIDLLPSTARPGNAGVAEPNGPLTGRSAGGRPAAGPGWLGFEIWTGLHRDLDADGFVGRAGDDPYRGGGRPIPDDYYNHLGEFIGAAVVDDRGAALDRFTVIARPLPAWPPGAAVHTVLTGTPSVYNQNGCTAFNAVGCWTVTDPVLAGADPVALPAYLDGTTLGRYFAYNYLFLPFGTRDFAIELCTPVLQFPQAVHGIRHDEAVWDCDVVEPLGP
ncbi:MAG TPA: hypothetical protein VM889_13630 [Candidatus Thermoplasmatota archaeon]|nr:hypothetical protein [Candidatus Thermoplasmatota archaeon]